MLFRSIVCHGYSSGGVIPSINSATGNALTVGSTEVVAFENRSCSVMLGSIAGELRFCVFAASASVAFEHDNGAVKAEQFTHAAGSDETGSDASDVDAPPNEMSGMAFNHSGDSDSNVSTGMFRRSMLS